MGRWLVSRCDGFAYAPMMPRAEDIFGIVGLPILLLIERKSYLARVPHGALHGVHFGNFVQSGDESSDQHTFMADPLERCHSRHCNVGESPSDYGALFLGAESIL